MRAMTGTGQPMHGSKLFPITPLLQQLNALHHECDAGAYATRLEVMLLQGLGKLILSYLLHAPEGFPVEPERPPRFADVVEAIRERGLISISLLRQLLLIRERCTELKRIACGAVQAGQSEAGGSPQPSSPDGRSDFRELKNELDVIATPVLTELSLTTSRLIRMIEIERASAGLAWKLAG